MAVRILTYLGLLYQDLARQHPSAPKLPPVLPIVLYNGKRPWGAATEISQIIEPPPGRLADFTPHLRYLLLDEGALDETAPLAFQNLAAALFRLEKSPNPAALERALGALTTPSTPNFNHNPSDTSTDTDYPSACPASHRAKAKRAV